MCTLRAQRERGGARGLGVGHRLRRSSTRLGVHDSVGVELRRDNWRLDAVSLTSGGCGMIHHRSRSLI